MFNLKTIHWLYIVSFADLFGVSLIVPLLANYMRSLGASHFFVGLCGSLYSGIQLVSGPFIGSWSDINGRGATLAFVLAVCSLCYSLLGVIPVISFILIFRVILGMFKHTHTLIRALVADIVPPEKHAEVFGRLSAMSGAGFMVGPALGGHLVEFNNGYFYVLQLVALLFIMNAGIAYIFLWNSQLKELHIKDTNVKQHKKSGISEVFAELLAVDWFLYWDLFSMKFLLGFSQKLFYSTYSMVVEEKFQLTAKWVGYTISFQGMIGAICAFSMGWIERHFFKNQNANFLILLGFSCLSLSFLALSLVMKFSLFVLFLIPLSFSFSLLRVVGTKLTIERTHPSKRGSVVGTSNSITSIASLIAPLISGAILEYWGPTSVQLLAVVSSGCGALLSLSFPVLLSNKR